MKEKSGAKSENFGPGRIKYSVDPCLDVFKCKVNNFRLLYPGNRFKFYFIGSYPSIKLPKFDLILTKNVKIFFFKFHFERKFYAEMVIIILSRDISLRETQLNN